MFLFFLCIWQIIASVGLDMKLYTFDTGSKKPSSCIPYEAPFSSLAFTDDGLTLAAGTSTGQVVFYDVRGKPQPITVLRAYGNSEVIISFQESFELPIRRLIMLLLLMVIVLITAKSTCTTIDVPWSFVIMFERFNLCQINPIMNHSSPS